MKNYLFRNQYNRVDTYGIACFGSAIALLATGGNSAVGLSTFIAGLIFCLISVSNQRTRT